MAYVYILLNLLCKFVRVLKHAVDFTQRHRAKRRILYGLNNKVALVKNMTVLSFFSLFTNIPPTDFQLSATDPS